MYHTVFFWLKSDLSEEQVALFESELTLITKIPYLVQAHASKPAATEHRDGVTDNSFSYSLILEFANMEDHIRYQTNDTDHDRFVDTCKDLWDRVVVRDSEPYA